MNRTDPGAYEYSLAHYRELVIERERKFAEHATRAANAIFARMRSFAVSFRTSEESRAAFELLLSDPDGAVRKAAAVESLAWGSPEGIETLEALEKDSSAGLHGLEARYVLIEYRAGRLSFDQAGSAEKPADGIGEEERERALAFHGLVMSGGVFHAIDMHTPLGLGQAIAGYRSLKLSSAAGLLARAALLELDDRASHEIALNDAYFDLFARDDRLV